MTKVPASLRALCAGVLAFAVSSSVLIAQRSKPPAAVPAPDNATCLACHDDPSLVSAAGKKVAVDPKKFDASVHGGIKMACVDCHVDLKKVEDFPHAEKLARADCSGCHEDQVKKYEVGIHAKSRQQANALAATCVDCHTSHEMRASKDPLSTTYPLNLPATCSRCHGDAETIKKGHIQAGDVASLYKDSIHGRAIAKSGLLVAANCTSCHGSHEVRPKSDPASSVHRANVPATCGACHEGIRAQYADSVHGAALSSGKPKAPVCVDCHSAHQIQRADVATWQLDVIRECGTCHVDNIKTYRDTFHGQVTSLGFVRVATCASCHGAHTIHPSKDARSMTSPARRLATCQQCHPDATEKFAQYDPHADKHNRERNPALYYSAGFMKWLLVGVFSFFGLHAALWLPRGFKQRRRTPAPPPESEQP